MKLIVQPLKLIEILAFVWTGIKLFITDCRRYYYREETVVKTKSGFVKGFKIASSFDYSYFNFIGIPYATAPIGELRFKVSLVSFHFISFHWNQAVLFELMKDYWIRCLGSPAIWTIKWNYQSGIQSPGIDGMPSWFANTLTDREGELPSPFSFHAWCQSNEIETDNGLYPWRCLHFRFKCERFLQPGISATQRHHLDLYKL